MSDNKEQFSNVKALEGYKSVKLGELNAEIRKTKNVLDEIKRTLEEKREKRLAELAEKEAQANEQIIEEQAAAAAKKKKEKAEKTEETVAPVVEEKAKAEEQHVVEAEKPVKEKDKPVEEKPAEKPVEAKTEEQSAEAKSPTSNYRPTDNPRIMLDVKTGRRIYIPQENPRSQGGNRNERGGFNKGGNKFGNQNGERPFGERNFGDKDRPQDRNGTFNRDKNGQRPGGFDKKPTGGAGKFTADAAMNIPVGKDNRRKKDGKAQVDEKNKVNSMNKRTLIRKGFIDDGSYVDEEDRMGARRKARRTSSHNEDFTPAPVVIDKAVITTENVTVKTLSEKIGKPANDILKHLFDLGIMCNINGSIDFDSAEMVAAEYGIELIKKVEKTYEEVLNDFHEDEVEDIDKMVVRPPVVTIMGHVDHGKTSILDYIRKSNVASGEAGGITQHIGAYTITLNGSPITFLDTPGHEAFTSMRERGAQVTDIAVIVVAADDGIMPQTIEAINHAKAAKVSIIVAINKMDKPEATPDRVMQQLTEHDLVPEAWGGDVITVPVSAKTGMGINDLLESILTVAEVKDLRANPEKSARGSIIEAKLDKGKGPVATVLVQNGTLKVGDFVVAGTATGRIRAMIDDKGRNVKEAGPSIPVSVLGFSEVPNAGDQLMAVEDEKLAKQVAEERLNKAKLEMSSSSSKMNLDDVFSKISEGDMKELNIIVKADVQGSVEAVKQSLEKLGNEEVKVVVIHGGVGAINESDVMLAGTSSAIVIGFNVRPDANAKKLAETKGVEIRTYRIIYDAIDDVTNAIKGKLAPKFREEILGHAEVRNTFKVSGVGTIAGCYITDGKVVRNSKLRLLRDNVVIYEGAVSSLKRFKDDVKEVATGYECGIGIEGYNDIKDNDVIESFILQQEEV